MRTTESVLWQDIAVMAEDLAGDLETRAPAPNVPGAFERSAYVSGLCGLILRVADASDVPLAVEARAKRRVHRALSELEWRTGRGHAYLHTTGVWKDGVRAGYAYKFAADAAREEANV